MFIFWSVLAFFHSTQGLVEVPKDIVAASEPSGATGQINRSQIGIDSQFKQFEDVFNHYVNLTVLENEKRNILSNLSAVNSTNGEQQVQNRALEWYNAINAALAEENITEFQQNNEESARLIETNAGSRENVISSYLQSLESDIPLTYNENELFKGDPYAGAENGTIDENNPFWKDDDAPTRRIFKGKYTKISQYPFMASVLVLGRFSCAGAIIKDDLVITAASCLQLVHNNRFFRENPALVEVRVGSPFFIIGGEVIPVVEVYFHPQYNPTTLRDNLSIMRLRRVIKFKRRKVQKIEFDTNPEALPEDTPPITILGWGSLSKSNKLYYKTKLHFADLDFYDHHSCKEIYGKLFVARENFCAGFITKGDGACNHDVGDPAISGRYLVGITSFGSPICGKVDTPTVFTKLGFYTDWIENIMDKEVFRYSKSTTTLRPPSYDKKIILYGLGEEQSPIPLQREGVKTKTGQDTSPVDADLQIVINELKKLGIDNTASKDLIQTLKYGSNHKDDLLPDEEQDPEARYSTPNGVLVNQYIESDHTAEEETGDPEIPELNNMPREGKERDESNYEGSTMISIEHVTKLYDFDTKQSMLRDSQSDREDSDRELPERVTVLPDETVSPKSAETNDINADETISKENTWFTQYQNKNNLPKDENDVKTLTNENSNPSEANTQSENNVTYVPENLEENFFLKEGTPEIGPLNILGHMQPLDLDLSDRNTPNHLEDKTKYKVAPIKVLGSESNEENDNNKSVPSYSLEEQDISKPSNIEVKRDRDQLQADLDNELANDIIKQEIQKIIQQLGISSEVHPITENPELIKFAENHIVRKNNNESLRTNRAVDSDTIFTLLYVPENATKSRSRKLATSESKSEESEQNLSIDPKPFQRRMRQRNDLVGKSEIYEIFANVMNTVVNKTLH